MDREGESIEAHDAERIPYCRVLGGPVPFRYCRTQGADAICRRIVNCWQSRFDVASFLVRCYGPERVRQWLAEPKEDRAVRMAEIAKKHARP